MLQLYDLLKDRLTGKAPKGAKRHKDWRRTRKEHLTSHPTCQACGGAKGLEVHHLYPFHLFPDLELSPKNLMTLCTKPRYGIKNCHLLYGHLGNFKNLNPNAWSDARCWREKLLGKTYGQEV